MIGATSQTALRARRRFRLALVAITATLCTIAAPAITPLATAAPAASQPPAAGSDAHSPWSGRKGSRGTATSTSTSTSTGTGTSTSTGTGTGTGTGTTVADVAKIIGATSPAAAGLDGSGVGIALIDTGVVPVPGLPASQIVNGPDLSFESQSESLRYLDTYGHGTHLAGIIVGDDPATGLKGIAPKAKLTSIKVGTNNGAVDVSQVIAALDWVVTHRDDDPANPIKVICLAYGTDAIADPGSDPLLYALENADRAGILVVVAAGNTGTSLNRVNSPAMDTMSMTVGSTSTQQTVSLADDRLSSFTSVDPSLRLDVVAPGESIISVRNPGSYIDTTHPGARVGETLFRGSGTSQAAAVVAAAAALALQKYPSMPTYRTRYLMRYSTTEVTGPNAERTYGSLNLAAALAAPSPKNPSSTGVSTGLGSLEAARGSIHAVDTSTELTGNSHLFGPFDASAWVTATKAGAAWKGGLWMGHRLAGDGWTGTSWASKTWAGAIWKGTTWRGASWVDSGWSGRYWAGRYWAGGNWSGRYWSSSTWEGKTWSTARWG